MPRPGYIKYLFIFVFALNFSCSDNKIISDTEKFASLYIELQLSMEKNRGNLSIINSEREKIFRKYRVTDVQYNRTLEYYGEDKEKWENFFNTVTAQLNKMKKKV